MALELGYLTDPNRVLVESREAALLPDQKIVYIVTGSQGEPMAVLSRIANGDHREVSIGAGDTVIVSATPIPGNETSVFRIINKLFRAGADVIYQARALVHVSGHASRDELADMLERSRRSSWCRSTASTGTWRSMPIWRWSTASRLSTSPSPRSAT